jgi:hypothetical protein
MSELRTPPPPRVIPDGVDFRGSHPKPSQIGVHFSDFTQFGVEFGEFPLCYFVPFVVNSRLSPTYLSAIRIANKSRISASFFYLRALESGRLRPRRLAAEFRSNAVQ